MDIIQNSNLITNWLTAHPFLMVLVLVWSLAWKGFALWKSAERGQKYWFVAMLLINTVGILEIIYLFFVSPKYEVEIVEKNS